VRHFLNFAVIEDKVQFLKDIRASYSSSDISILIEGSIGPKGDACKPDEELNVDLA
jgi:hypothetical protein